MEYSIGDLSKITRVSGKTLHKFHQEGLVIPSRIDKFTSHRYYDEKCLHRVEIVNRFHELGIPPEIIKEVLAKHKDTRNLFRHLQSSLVDGSNSWEALGLPHEMCQTFLNSQSAAKINIGSLSIKILPDVLVACDRFHGKSRDISLHHNNLSQACGDLAIGQPITLFHDDHQFNDEMDLECCLPVEHTIPVTGITYRTLRGTKAVTVVYEGHSEGIWMGYQKIIDYLNKNRLAIQSPSREVKIGDGGIRLSEDDQLTRVEIQFLIGDVNDPSFTRDVSRPGFGIDAKFDL